MLNDEIEIIRVNACENLTNSSSVSTLELLKEIVRKDTALVKGYAILSIINIAKNAKVSKSQIIEFLETNIKREKNIWVKIHYYKALYLLGQSKYLDSIIDQLNSVRYRNRCSATNILVDIATSNTKVKIEGKLKERAKIEKSVAVKSSITNALEELQALAEIEEIQ